MTDPTTLRQKAIDMRCDSMCCRGKGLGVALSSQCRSAVPSGPSRKRVSALRAAATDARVLAFCLIALTAQFAFLSWIGGF